MGTRSFDECAVEAIEQLRNALGSVREQLAAVGG